MSIARELFLEAGPSRFRTGIEAVKAYDKLLRAADLWREDGEFFSAGMAMLDACYAAWGHPDRMLDAILPRPTPL